MDELCSLNVIEEFHFCPDYFFPSTAKYGPVGRPFSEFFFWLVFISRNRKLTFDLILLHTVDSLSGTFLMSCSTKKKIPVISLVPNMLTKESFLFGGYGFSMDIVPIGERLKHESLALFCRRAISKISGLVAISTLRLFLRLTSSSRMTKPAHQFDSAQILQYLCDTREAGEALRGAGISENRVKLVTFDRDIEHSIGLRKHVLVILGDEPTIESLARYNETLEDALRKIGRLHPTSNIVVRPHPSSTTTSTNRAIIDSLSVQSRKFLLDEPRLSPVSRAIESSTRIYGVLSSSLLEALQIGFDEVFGLVDLNTQLGYPQPDIPGITWVENDDLKTAARLAKISGASPRALTRSNRPLSDVVSSVVSKNVRL